MSIINADDDTDVVAWYKACVQAAEEGEIERSIWSRLYRDKMSFDEFHFRRRLAEDVRNESMIPPRAAEVLKAYLQHKS